MNSALWFAVIVVGNVKRTFCLQGGKDLFFSDLAVNNVHRVYNEQFKGRNRKSIEAAARSSNDNDNNNRSSIFFSKTPSQRIASSATSTSA